MLLLWLRQFPQCGDWTPASVPPSAKGRSRPTNTPVFPLGSFTLPSFAWFYIFFSSGQVLLSALRWCSACTSVSEGAFLMYLWREMYSSSTYFCTTLFSLLCTLLPLSLFQLHLRSSWRLSTLGLTDIFFAKHPWLFFKIRPFKVCFLMEILCRVLWSKSFK